MVSGPTPSDSIVDRVERARARQAQAICYSDIDIRNALARASVSRGVSSQKAFGLEIVVRAPIIAPRPYIIPASAEGVTIRETGAAMITSTSVLEYLFVVRASRVRLLDLTVGQSRTGGFTGFALVEASSAARVDGLVIDGVEYDSADTAAGAFVESTSSYARNVRITNNRATQNFGSGVFARISGGRWIITGNTLTEYESIRDTVDGGSAVISSNSLGVASILMRLGSGHNVISGNDIGGDVDTDTSAGRNAIVGNVIDGTITAHATDTVGLNA